MRALLRERFLHAVAVLAGAFVLTFLLLHALPGDPYDRLDSPAMTAEEARRTREALGLDRPLPVQLLTTVASYARGDLGVSFARQRPVVRVLAAALPATAILGLAGLALAYGAGVPLAIVAWRAGPRARGVVDRLALLFAVTPRFWFGVVLVWVFHSWAGWLPASHAGPPGGASAVAGLRYLILPTVTLGLPAAAAVARYQLAMLEREAGRPHVRAARATGSSERRIVLRHLLRPSLVPLAAMLALDLRVLASGALVVEMVFAWPGIGRVAAEAVQSSDYPVALAAGTLSATLVVVGRFAAESLTVALDPRAGLRDGSRR